MVQRIRMTKLSDGHKRVVRGAEVLLFLWTRTARERVSMRIENIRPPARPAKIASRQKETGRHGQHAREEQPECEQNSLHHPSAQSVTLCDTPPHKNDLPNGHKEARGAFAAS